MTLDEKIARGAALLRKAERHNALAARAMAQLHELASEVVAAHGCAAGASPDVVASVTAPKDDD